MVMYRVCKRVFEAPVEELRDERGVVTPESAAAWYFHRYWGDLLKEEGDSCYLDMQEALDDLFDTEPEGLDYYVKDGRQFAKCFIVFVDEFEVDAEEDEPCYKGPQFWHADLPQKLVARQVIDALRRI